MVSVMREPVPALAPFVDVLWYIDEPSLHGLERAIPNGAMQLVVNLNDDILRWYDGETFETVHTTHGSGLCGALARPVGIDTADQRLCVGAGFRPGGAVSFFHPPADVLTEPVIGLDSLWGRDGALLRERLLEQPTPEATLLALERVLLDRVVRPAMKRHPSLLAPDPAVEHAVTELSHGAAVGEVADHLGLSSSSFNRRFRAGVGLNPKPFARVRRLQRVLERVRNGTEHDWADLAAEYGYFDQAHMINEFRALAGVTPGRYRPRSPAEQNHVPIGQ